jgi:hypothetical protein
VFENGKCRARVASDCKLPEVFEDTHNTCVLPDYSYICKVPANFVGGHDTGTAYGTCANAMASFSTSGYLSGIDFSHDYDCSSSLDNQVAAINQVAGWCCGGQNGDAAPESACHVDVETVDHSRCVFFSLHASFFLFTYAC